MGLAPAKGRCRTPLPSRLRLHVAEFAAHARLDERGQLLHPFDDPADAHFAQRKFAPKIRLELGSNEAITHSVAAGLGIGIVSRHALPARPQDEALAILRVEDFPIHSNWWALYPRGKRLSPIAAVFLDHLVKTAADLNPGR